jgi:hypothetical protein
VGYPKAKRAKKAQTVLNKFNKIIKQIITFKKPFFTLVNLNRIGWSISGSSSFLVNTYNLSG